MRCLSIIRGQVVVLLVLLLASCGGSQPPVLQGVSVTQVSWDTLDVIAPSPEGGPAPNVVVFDAAHDTLYVGPPARVGIPDAALGDAEPILVEVCAAIAQRLVCEQEGLRASPKRVVALKNDWDLPNVHNPARGRYALRLAVERQRFDDTTFERIDASAAVQAHVVATVDEHPGTGVQLPLTGATGVVNLTDRPGYRDFAFHLRAARVDGRPAAVTYAVYARLQNDPPVRVASHTHHVIPPTRAEQALHVEWFAEQAGTQLLKVLDARGRYQGDVFVDGWRYQPGLGQYTVTMELRVYWPGRRWRGELLRGTLQVQQDGRQPRFAFTRGNRRALHRWQRQEVASVLSLERFYPLEVLPRIPGGVQTASAEPDNEREAPGAHPPLVPDRAAMERGRGGW
ncbi:MAG: hypothetical protein GVY15_01715 [Bacteroidetes bacterium]|jgi:hypothetical protein|nr:hypothetical protein [Bacteroidota bacterium]